MSLVADSTGQRVRRMGTGVVGGLPPLALILFVLLTVNGLPHTTHQSMPIAPRIATSPEEPPAQTAGQR
jgi:hypothetical protein